MSSSTTSTEPKRQFASDNYAGFCPEAWAALAKANQDHAPAYGDDPWTLKASEMLRELFEIDCDVYFCFNGTAANALAVSHMCQSYHSVLCHTLAHLETDECGAPEFFSNGTKLLLVDGPDGKLTPDAVAQMATKRGDIHFPKPRVLSITQATEMGTVYSISELDALRETARRHHLRIHMDGARFANAMAHLKAAPKDITWKVGVDVLCFGGTKMGLPIGEAVVFFDKNLSREFDYRCKQGGQLASKMRFISAPWVGMLEAGAWLDRAASANKHAQELAALLRDIPGVQFLAQPQANSVFVEMPVDWQKALRRKGWRFYNFIGSGGARFMCSWDTREEDIQALARDIREIAK